MGTSLVERLIATRAKSGKRGDDDRRLSGLALACRWTIRHSGCRIPRSLARRQHEKSSLAAHPLCHGVSREVAHGARRHLSLERPADKLLISIFRETRLESRVGADPSLPELPGKPCNRTSPWRAGSKSLRDVAEKAREALAMNPKIARRSTVYGGIALYHELAR